MLLIMQTLESRWIDGLVTSLGGMVWGQSAGEGLGGQEVEALATPFPLPAAALLSFLHPAQGTSLVGSPSSRPMMNIPYWECFLVYFNLVLCELPRSFKMVFGPKALKL